MFKLSTFKWSKLKPQYHILLVWTNYFCGKEKVLSSQSWHPALCITRDHITSKHALKHLGQRVTLCLVHSDLKSLAANDYLCWTRVQSCHKLSWLVLITTLGNSSKFRHWIILPSVVSLVENCPSHPYLSWEWHTDLDEWRPWSLHTSLVIFTRQGQIQKYMRKRRVRLLLLIFKSLIQGNNIQE